MHSTLKQIGMTAVMIVVVPVAFIVMMIGAAIEDWRQDQ